MGGSAVDESSGGLLQQVSESVTLGSVGGLLGVLSCQNSPQRPRADSFHNLSKVKRPGDRQIA